MQQDLATPPTMPTDRASWRAGAGATRRYGALSARVIAAADGAPRRTILLLHGLASTQLQFGGEWDRLAAHGTVVIPDLLGFGGSLDRRRRTFTLEDHLAAVDELLRQTGTDDGELVVAGHSLGGALAPCVAARHVDDAAAVVTWGAPLYADAHDARTHIRRMGRVNAYVGLDTRLAQVACRTICTQGWLARPIYRKVRPRLPIEVLDAAVQHTWWSYVGALRSIILDAPWMRAMDVLADAGVPVTLQVGSRDSGAHLDLLRRIEARGQSISFEVLPDMDHGVAISHPAACVATLVDQLASIDAIART